MRLDQRGFTMVELLIGIALSLFISTMAITYFVSSSRTFNLNASEAFINENQRFSTAILAQGIRRAGANSSPLFNNSRLNFFYTATQCDDGTGSLLPCTGLGGGPNLSDSLAVRYVLSNTESCNGTQVDDFLVPSNEDNVVDIYRVVIDPVDGSPNLSCQTFLLNERTNTWVAQGNNLPLVGGVDMMKVSFAVDTDDDLIVDRYATIDEVNFGGWWSNIRAVRLGLLVNAGQADVQTSNAEDRRTELVARTYSVLGVASQPFNDRLTRKVFTTTIHLPNAVDQL